MAKSPELSIIVPTLNESALVGDFVERVASQSLRLEIIVADGGSQDETCSRADAAGARVVHGPPGRGVQMNQGANAASSPFLLFLHVDSVLAHRAQLRDALGAFKSAHRADGRVAGHFELRFIDRPLGYDGLFRFMEAKTRSGRRGTINGDQGLMIHRDYFSQLGGFDESLPHLEDQRIARRIFDDGRWILLPGNLATSARRFAREGTWQRYALMGLIMSLHETKREDLLRELPRLYVEQSRATLLRLSPLARVLRKRLLRELISDPGIIELLGEYICANLWQLPFGLDVARGRAVDQEWTRRFERHVLPRLHHRPGKIIAAALAASLMLGVIPVLERMAAR